MYPSGLGIAPVEAFTPVHHRTCSTVDMCYTTGIFLRCAFCNDDVAEVFRYCTDGNGTAVMCNGDAMAYSCETIFVKHDYAADITYVCGWCACYASLHVTDMEEPPFTVDYVRACANDPSDIKEHILKTLHESPLSPAEDGSVCGYMTNDGHIVTIICNYEVNGTINATTIYEA